MKIIKIGILLTIIGFAFESNAQTTLERSSKKVLLDSVDSSADLIPNAQMASIPWTMLQPNL